MKLNDQEIENVLRGAPTPKAPATLKSRLTVEVKLAAPRDTAQPRLRSIGLGAWLRRWWPALAPASVSLACAAMMVSQELEIRALQQNNRRLVEQRAPLPGDNTNAPADSLRRDRSASDAATAEQNEITRLKERADQLSVEVARLEKMQAENENLRKQPVTPTGLNEEQLADLAKAREKAMSIQCVNNLKQIGLAVRVWQLDNSDVTPPNFLSASNELSTPKILACPADTNRVAATTFANYTEANCSYEYLVPSAKDADREPQRVLTRCPIHGHVGLCDGSVQGEVAKKHPERLITHDQKLYLDGY